MMMMMVALQLTTHGGQSAPTDRPTDRPTNARAYLDRLVRVETRLKRGPVGEAEAQEEHRGDLHDRMM
jgi:hypothetical protein